VVVTQVVHGDPASLSQTGGALRQLATRLRTTGRTAHAAFDDAAADDAAGGRRDRVVTAARRQYDAVDAAAAAAAVELDRAGAAVQAHASDLAEALAHARSLAARADAAGLQVVEGVLVPAWGVAGVADGSAARSREQVQQQLQGELDQLGVLLARRRSALVATLAGSRDLLGTHAARLR
jgi:hypothetical protein